MKRFAISLATTLALAVLALGPAQAQRAVNLPQAGAERAARVQGALKSSELEAVKQFRELEGIRNSTSSARAAKHTPRTIYVFGDSLSDNGNGCALYYDLFFWGCNPPYALQRFSNGLIWSDYLAKAVGSTITAVVDGGSNYAIGGSTISPENYYTFDPYATGFAQVDRFLAAHGLADPNAIYVVWLGTNDIDPPATFTEWNFEQLVVMVGRLHAAGARNFLIPNLLDIGQFPGIIFFFDPVYVQQLSDMTILFNQLLMGLPARFPDANIRIADVYRLRTMIDRYPRVFGFTNTTASCYLSYSDGSLCPNPDKYWFWDGSHPTTRGHQLLASLFVVELLKAGQLKRSDLDWRH